MVIRVPYGQKLPQTFSITIRWLWRLSSGMSVRNPVTTGVAAASIKGNTTWRPSASATIDRTLLQGKIMSLSAK
jgi:hypothetical protein